MKNLVSIVSDGGHANGTVVYNYDGAKICNVAKIEILPFEHDGLIIARIELVVQLGIGFKHRSMIEGDL